MTKILLLDGRWSGEFVDSLRRRYPQVDFVGVESRSNVTDLIVDVDAVFGTLTDVEFAAAPRLRWIQSGSAGVEWLWKSPAVVESKVVVTNMRGAHAVTIAEHAFGLLLFLTRGLRQFDDLQRQEVWARGQRPINLRGIKGMTMGIIGFGNIGRAIARRARGFELDVLAVDAQSMPGNEDVQEVWKLDRLNDMCRASNVLAIAAPITPETRGMVGAEQLGLMPDRSYLLAMSRGGIVQETALLDALHSGKLSGAGLDVTTVEPLPAGHPLWHEPNVIITPHISPSSALTSDLVWSIFSDNLARFLSDQPLTNLVDKTVGY